MRCLNIVNRHRTSVGNVGERDLKFKRSAKCLAQSLLALLATACVAQTPQPPTYRWTEFVKVEGQPEPVPAEWVATPEGKIAHSIKVPNPLPRDSGYRPGMTSEQYFDHLCRTEAGEVIYRTVENVEGFYFMRPPRFPSDSDLMDRYKLEAPGIERFFQLIRPTAAGRSTVFVGGKVRKYRYAEEMTGLNDYVKAFGYKPGTVQFEALEKASMRTSRYGLTWRGIKRPYDREHLIGGSEWIVIDLNDDSVLSVLRNFSRTGGIKGADGGIWWLNPIQCPSLKVFSAADVGQQIYSHVVKVLKPEGRE